jgi:hypothetical protein
MKEFNYIIPINVLEEYPEILYARVPDITKKGYIFASKFLKYLLYLVFICLFINIVLIEDFGILIIKQISVFLFLIVIVILNLLFEKREMKFKEIAWYMRSLVNDVKILEKNFGTEEEDTKEKPKLKPSEKPKPYEVHKGKSQQSIINSYFKILAFLKYRGDTTDMWKYVKEFSRAKSPRNSLKKAKNKMKGLGLISEDENGEIHYIPWEFEIIDKKGRLNEIAYMFYKKPEYVKEHIESNLKNIWNNLLFYEFQRMKVTLKPKFEIWKRKRERL